MSRGYLFRRYFPRGVCLVGICAGYLSSRGYLLRGHISRGYLLRGYIKSRGICPGGTYPREYVWGFQGVGGGGGGGG